MAKILITGASGHLGAALVRAALKAGHDVRALVRASSDRRGLQGVEAELVEGDVLDEASLAGACEGREIVLHAAAVHRNWAPNEEDILAPAVRGTENVVRAAAGAGVRRVVLVSSNAAVGYGSDPKRPLDERSWNEAPHAVYIRAKTQAERRGLELGKELGIEVVSALPCGIVGPWDHKPTPTTKSVLAMATGGPSVIDVAVTDVRDVAAGVLLAAEKGRPGERYLLAGENCTKERLAELVSAVTGKSVRPMLPPRPVMWMLAAAGELRARFGGPSPDITRDELADVYGRHLLYDSKKARTELGWSPRPADAAVKDAIAWAVSSGLMKASDDLRARLPADPEWSAPVGRA
jgi:dihydroflavonol-4-reductase